MAGDRGAPATQQVSRAAKLRTWGRVRKPHNSITARPWRSSLPDEDHGAFPPQARPRAPLDARTPSPGYIGAMANPFGIVLSRLRTEWAAKQGVSETIAAAVYLLSENRRAEEVRAS